MREQHALRKPLKYATERRDAVDIVSKMPGITVLDARAILAEGHGHQPVQMGHMLMQMCKVGLLARTSTNQGGKYTHKLYPAKHPDVVGKDTPKKNGGSEPVHNVAPPTSDLLKDWDDDLPAAPIVAEPAKPALPALLVPPRPAVPPQPKLTLTLDDGRDIVLTATQARLIVQQLKQFGIV